MICWYCHWGWSKAVADIYRKHVAVAGEMAMDYGPAHVVWADENWHSVQWCLDHFDEHARQYEAHELAAVRQSLLDLLALPADVLDPCPAGYDDQHPDRFPPVAGVEMDRSRGRLAKAIGGE